ncbi:hypothetical protein Tco_0851695 [Tanacetum coccineum]
MEECHKLLTDQVDDAILRYNVSKPLPLGGDPGHVIIQPDFFFNKDLEYLWYGRKIGRPALSISKMKAAYYPDVGLEQMVPDQMWIEEECKYDVAAMYGISHWWFQRQRFYIDRHTSEGDRRASYKDGKVRHSIPQSHQSQRDLPRDNLLVSVEVLSSNTISEVAYFKVSGKEILARLHKDRDADASFHFRNPDKYYHNPEECEYAGPKVTTSHEANIPQQG